MIEQRREWFFARAAKAMPVLLAALAATGCSDRGLKLSWFMAEPVKAPATETVARASEPVTVPPTPPEVVPVRPGGASGPSGASGQPASPPRPHPAPSPIPTSPPAQDPQNDPRQRPPHDPRQDPAPAPKPPKPGPAPIGQALRDVLEQTNAYRERTGLAPLKLNARLSRAAQLYAERMAGEGFFDHYSPDGDSPGDRILASGYRPLTWGENIALGYREAAEVMNGWIGSPGHRQNLLNARFEEIGLGWAVGFSTTYGVGTIYWVQEFATAPGVTSDASPGYK